MRQPAGAPGSVGGQFAPHRSGEATFTMPPPEPPDPAKIAVLRRLLPPTVSALLIDADGDGLHVEGAIVAGQRVDLEDAGIDPAEISGEVAKVAFDNGEYRLGRDETHGTGFDTLPLYPDPWRMDPDGRVGLAFQAIQAGDADLVIECWDAGDEDPEFRASDGVTGDSFAEVRDIGEYMRSVTPYDRQPMDVDVIDYESGGGLVVSVPIGGGFMLAKTLDAYDVSEVPRGEGDSRAQAAGIAAALIGHRKALLRTLDLLGGAA